MVSRPNLNILFTFSPSHRSFVIQASLIHAFKSHSSSQLSLARSRSKTMSPPYHTHTSPIWSEIFRILAHKPHLVQNGAPSEDQIFCRFPGSTFFVTPFSGHSFYLSNLKHRPRQKLHAKQRTNRIPLFFFQYKADLIRRWLTQLSYYYTYANK